LGRKLSDNNLKHNFIILNGSLNLLNVIFFLFLGLASLTSLNGMSRMLARQRATPRHREQVNNVFYSADVKGTMAGNVFSEIPPMSG
jgi:hypothetical protein